MKMLLTLKVWMEKESFFTVIDTFEDEQSAMRIVTMMMILMHCDDDDQDEKGT